MNIAEFRAATPQLDCIKLAREWFAKADQYLFAEEAIPGDVADQIATKDGTIPAKFVNDLENRWGTLIEIHGART